MICYVVILILPIHSMYFYIGQIMYITHTAQLYMVALFFYLNTFTYIMYIIREM